MKKKTTIFLIPLLLAFAGCEEKENKCVDKGYGMPEECYDCEWYAPEGVNVSWTDYNTVSSVIAYFSGHRETLREHSGDTIKIEGWVCRMDSINYTTWRMYLADTPHPVQGTDMMIWTMLYSTDVSHYYNRKVYLDCRVHVQTPEFAYPCDYNLYPELLSIDTIRN